jgi:hypothetical protein
MEARGLDANLRLCRASPPAVFNRETSCLSPNFTGAWPDLLLRQLDENPACA